MDHSSYFPQLLDYVPNLAGGAGLGNFHAIINLLPSSEVRGSDYPSPPPPLLRWCRISLGVSRHTSLLLQHSSGRGFLTHSSYLPWGRLFIKGQEGRRLTKIEQRSIMVPSWQVHALASSQRRTWLIGEDFGKEREDEKKRERGREREIRSL